MIGQGPVRRPTGASDVLARLAIVMLAALAGACVLFGQAVNFAQIHGRVSDATGAAIVGAQITASQFNTGLVRTTVSGSEGNYFLPNLPVGPYQLKVSATGFRNFLQTGIVLQVGETPEVNIKLVVGSVAETVEVRADAALVETHENSISTMIDNARILELPLDGRNMVSLVMGSGAATNPTLTSNDLNSTKNYGNGIANGPSQPISVGGGQENANNFLLDGSDNNDAFSNVNAPYPFPDAIQEFSVQSSGLSARYGVHAGATVNAVTKSGTNAYHGSVFEFLRVRLQSAGADSKPQDYQQYFAHSTSQVPHDAPYGMSCARLPKTAAQRRFMASFSP